LTSKKAAPAPEEHSDLVGGSSAARRIACPGSYQMEQKLPPSDGRESSTYADEGTALHECMAYILTKNIVDLDEVLGMTFGVSESSPAGYVITKELMRDAIIPCVDFFDDLVDRIEAADGGFEFLIEVRCEMPGIPRSFGTSDVLWRSPKRSGVVDWKFGAGVPVKASYVVDDKTRGNDQLMYYGRSGQHSYPKMFCEDDGTVNPKRIVELTIVQPRSRYEQDEIFSRHNTSIKELEEFRVELIRAVAEATGDSPKIERGEHCRFAKCKKICPAFTTPGFQLAQMSAKLNKMKEEPLGTVAVDWPELYSQLLDYATIAELAAKEIRAGAHAFLESGEKIPGWKLVDSRPTEQYVDEQGAVRHAIGLGAEESQCFEMKTKSPARLRDDVLAPLMEGKTKKAREEAAKAEIAKFTRKVSSGTTLAKGDDNREDAILPSDLMSSLANKLAALTGR